MSAKCDPEWHDGAHVDAAYYVRVPDEDEPGSTTVAFACCRIHVETAVHVVMRQRNLTSVIVQELPPVRDEQQRTVT